jgi:hypothetical protein
MNGWCKTYIIVYIVYLLFGYECVTKLINGKSIKFINDNIGLKRLLQLSLITLLINALCFNCECDITLYVIAILLNIIVCVGYFIKFYPLTDPLTWIFHILWAVPIFIAPLFCKITGELNKDVILIVTCLLILYKFILEDYVYGS